MARVVGVAVSRSNNPPENPYNHPEQHITPPEQYTTLLNTHIRESSSITSEDKGEMWGLNQNADTLGEGVWNSNADVILVG